MQQLVGLPEAPPGSGSSADGRAFNPHDQDQRILIVVDQQALDRLDVAIAQAATQSAHLPRTSRTGRVTTKPS